MVIGLGGLNLFGVIILGTMLKYVLHMMRNIISWFFNFFFFFQYPHFCFSFPDRDMAVAPSSFIKFVADIFPLLQVLTNISQFKQLSSSIVENEVINYLYEGTF